MMGWVSVSPGASSHAPPPPGKYRISHRHGEGWKPVGQHLSWAPPGWTVQGGNLHGSEE